MSRNRQDDIRQDPPKNLSEELDRNNLGKTIEDWQQNCNTLAHQITDWEIERFVADEQNNLK